MLFPFLARPASPARVVVTGGGIVTSLGQGWKTNSEGFRNGHTAFRDVTLFDVSRQRVKTAGQVALPAIPSRTRLTQRQAARMDRASHLLLLATEEALQQSGWETEDPTPIVLGTTSGGMTLGEAYYRQAMHNASAKRSQPSRVMNYQVQQQALDLVNAFNLDGPITIVANACASGANAIGHAFDLIRRGSAQRVLTGGYDALCQLVFSGFDSLQALSTTSCKPFDAHRDGLALGEGAAVLTLESLEHARKRDAQILGEIVGYGAATDAHHLTQPHPDGNAALLSMQEAIAMAQLPPDKIGYINAHGTGTPLNDSSEAAAINRWAAGSVSNIAVSSTKASIGHLLGAAGAVETAVCLMALDGQWVPPSSTTNEVDPACRFQLVRRPLEKSFDYALTNSFGFGGSNATLIVRRWS